MPILQQNISDPPCKIGESNGFLQYICHDKKSDHTKHKCVNSDEYYYKRPGAKTYFSGAVCSNDPHFYQACDRKLGGQITNNVLLCEYYICENEDYAPDWLFTPVDFNLVNKCEIDCVNTDLNKKGCNDEMIALPSGELARPTDICNDVCDSYQCEDEGTCNGYTYGMYCKSWYIPPRSVCDGHSWCESGEDEENCTLTESTETSCTHDYTGKLVPVHNFTRCVLIDKQVYSRMRDWRKYCTFADIVPYQTNCSDQSRVGLTCRINGYLSTVSKYLICFDKDVNACDDRIDSNCYATKSCKVHKHLLCDDISDCSNGADEIHPICRSMTRAKCQRRTGIKGEMPIPISWLKDGVRDCENGIDETARWPMCGQGKSLRFISSDELGCENVFLCKTGTPGYVKLDDLCDGLETCGNENEICSVSSRSQSVTKSVPTSANGLTKSLLYCLKGLKSIQVHRKTLCISEHFIFPRGEIFGVETKTLLILPEDKQKCDYMYGELYLYTSCVYRCVSSTCPLRNAPRYEVCPIQFPNRVGTIVDNEYLIFFTKSFGSIYTNRYFVCDEKVKCVDYSKVCDLVYDCGDRSDEIGCTNHFKCNSSGKLLPKTKHCDGVIDCSDLSDECNGQCSKKILESAFLKGLSWSIGILAVIGNMVIVGTSIKVLKRCKTTAAVINRWLIVIIAFGDFLIGCYLLVIATYDAIIFKNDYCIKQIDWTSSLGCSVIGVFSTIGSQVSLFSMTGLSAVRVYGILNSMRIPGEITPLQNVKIAATIFSLIAMSTGIAVTPIIGIFEDFFVNGVKFSDRLRIFVGTPDKTTILGVIKAYYGRAKVANLNWKVLIEMVRDMFSHDLDYEDFTDQVIKLDFYGNDGVCLFKYFVKTEDPQRIFVWNILSLNFLCFIFISMSYLIIGVLSRGSSKNLTGYQNSRQLAKRNRRLNRRIAMIITTDFMCWVPFIMTCILHSLELLDATPWYSLFSIVILPINSVINPFLYDAIFISALRVPLRSFLNCFYNSFLLRNVRERLNPAQTDDTELDRFDDQDDPGHVEERLGNEGTIFGETRMGGAAPKLAWAE